MPNLKMPSDVDPAYAGSWEAFLELPDTKGKDPKMLAECFRVLLQQAGTKLKTLKKVGDWFTVNKLYADLNKALTQKFLLTHLVPQRHSFDIELNVDHLTNIVSGFTITGQVKMKPQRFDLDYLINRMVSVKVLKEFPDALKLSTVRTVKDGKVVQVKKDRRPANFSQLKRWDWVPMIFNPQFRVSIGRLKGDYLALAYEVYVTIEMPYYLNTEKELAAIWRRATLEDLR